MRSPPTRPSLATRAWLAADLLSVAVPGATAAQCLPGATIDTVIVETAEPSSAAGGGPDLLGRLGAALHVRTRPGIIRRTVLLGPGDCYDARRVAETERALWALGVLSTVRLDTVRLEPDGALALRVATTDGWTARPVADYTRAGGVHSWEVGYLDMNFLGTASHLLASYGSTPDRSTVAVEYRNPHTVVRGGAVRVRHAVRSNGRQTTWLAALPFREMASRRSASFAGEAVEESGLRYGARTATLESRSRAVRLRLYGGYAPHATSRGYLRLWAGAVWREEAWVPSRAQPYRPHAFTTFGTGLELARGRFRTTRGLNTYGRPEFVSLSRVLRLGIWAAPRAWGYPSARAGQGGEARLQLGTVLPGGHAVLRVDATGAVVGGVLDSGQVRSRLTLVVQPGARHTLLLSGDAGSMLGRSPPGVYDLWLEGRGPRLFPPHAFLGRRMWWARAEHRVLLEESLAGQVAIGIAPFVEYARAWQPGEAAAGGNAGVALRLVPLRFATQDVPELALGYRFGTARRGRRWAFGFRSGAAF